MRFFGGFARNRIGHAGWALRARWPQYSAAALCLALGSGATATGAAADARLAACRAIGDDAQRLQCYDRLAETAASAAVPAAAVTEAATPAPMSANGSASAQAASPRPPANSFGAETLARAANDGPSKLNAHLVDRIDGLSRGMIFHLDDGQVWKNIDDREYDFEGDRPAVSIERSQFGTYWLRLADAPFTLRVTRIR